MRSLVSKSYILSSEASAICKTGAGTTIESLGMNLCAKAPLPASDKLETCGTKLSKHFPCDMIQSMVRGMSCLFAISVVIVSLSGRSDLGKDEFDANRSSMYEMSPI